MKVIIAKKALIAKNVVAIEFITTDNTPLAPFSPGAHIDIQLGNGIVRQYSLYNHPSERNRYCVGVLLAEQSRGGSTAVHALNVGDAVEISEPRNHFSMHGNEEHSILIAGGIGITPVLCMAQWLDSHGAPFEFHYSARDAEHMAFREMLESCSWKDKVNLYFDTGPNARRIDLPTVLGTPRAGTHVYVCGPQGMIDAVFVQARSSGWPEGNLHREYFGVVVQVAGGDRAFEVELARSQKRILVLADQTIVSALKDAGIPIAVSCEQGICGTCLTRVISGQPDHRDMYLTEAERETGDQILPCCSRSNSDVLVLDL